MIAKRHVFHIAGYDTIAIASLHRRFRRELATFATTWKLNAQASDVIDADGAARWDVTTRGPGWQVDTTYEPLDWADLVRADMARSIAVKLARGLLAYTDFIVSGTLVRYFRANNRYGIFFLIPLLNIVFFATAAAFAGMLCAGIAAVYVPSALLCAAFGVAVFAAAFFALMRWPGRLWRVDHALADWICARDYMYGRRPDIDARLDAFASRILAAVAASEADEIILCAHSLGATLLMDTFARALARDSALGDHGPVVCVLTIGATIPKLALHPAGETVRRAVRRVADAPGLTWAEYQARGDAISFHRFHPVALRRFDDNDGIGPPHIRRVQIHEMLSDETFKRIRTSPMRLHYQFVMGNERRAAYDYFMLLCGPLRFRDVVASPRGAADLLGEDGEILQADDEAHRAVDARAKS